MFEPVAPIAAERPRGGLIAAATTSEGDVRWERGVSWRSESCPSAVGYGLCSTEMGEPVGEETSEVIYHEPVMMRFTDRCSTRSGVGDLARLRRQAEAGSSFFVARELLTGAISAANTYETPNGPGQVNAHLASADADVVPGVHEPHYGVGVLESVARASMLGQDVWLHMTPAVAALIPEMLVQRGNLLETQTGSRVVVDAGYASLDPDGEPAPEDVAWVYATGRVRVRLGAWVTDTRTVWETNENVSIVERPFTYEFDPCTLHSVRVATPTVAPDPA